MTEKNDVRGWRQTLLIEMGDEDGIPKRIPKFGEKMKERRKGKAKKLSKNRKNPNQLKMKKNEDVRCVSARHHNHDTWCKNFY